MGRGVRPCQGKVMGQAKSWVRLDKRSFRDDFPHKYRYVDP